MHTDVGIVRLVVCQQVIGVPTQRNIGRVVLQDLDLTKTLAGLPDHIEGLTLGIPDIRIKELPMRLQHHTICVPSCWVRLLCMIAQVVTCYNEHHQIYLRCFACILSFLGQMTKCVLETKRVIFFYGYMQSYSIDDVN